MKLRKTILISMVFLLVLGIYGTTYGQILTGSIRGTVMDEEGEVLPGVNVELKSPVLIGGAKILQTNERGFFYFSNLLPGVYELTFSLPGFQSLKKEGISVRVDSTVVQDVVLKMATVEETITVTAENPVLDVTKSGISTNWQTEMMDNLPLLRTCFFDLVNSTPGVWSHGGNTDQSRSFAYGTSSESNTYLFDGVDTTSPDYGAAWAWLNPDVVEELQVIGIGGKAEYGNFMGATINVVTKSGGNEFHGGAGALFQFDELTGDNSKTYLQDLIDAGYITEDDQFPYHRKSFNDLSFQLGGPIIKDKIWFFLSGWRQVDASSTAGVNPDFFTKWSDTQLFFKTTIQASKNIKIQGFFNYEWFTLPDPVTPEYLVPDAAGAERGTAPSGSLSLTAVLSNKTYMELKYSYTGGHDFYESLTKVEGFTYDYYRGPSYYDWNTDRYWGGPSWIYLFWPEKHQVNANLSHFAEDFLAGDHDFKIGVQYSRGHAEIQGGYNAGVSYAYYTYDYYGTPYDYTYRYDYAPFTYGASNEQIGVFMDDTWTVSDRLTINLGLRYDYNKGWIQDLPELIVDPVTYEWTERAMVPGRPDLVKWSVFSPRLGLVFKLTPDGKTLFRANFGRYYDHIIYGNWYLPSPTATTWYMYEWNGVDWDLVTSDPPTRVSIDPNLKNPYSDQFSIGIDRELLPNFGLSITYMEKWTKDLISFDPTTGDWDDYYQLTTQTDPLTGDSLQVYELIDEYPNIQITNPDKYYARFRMISIMANKRMSNNWQLSASLSFSKMWGLNPVGRSADPSWGENILWNMSEVKDPNNFLNIEGRLVGDRPFTLRILGTYIFPFDIAASVNFQVMSGTPYAREATIYDLNQGNVTLAVESRGDNDHRLPTAYLLDLNVEKTFKITDRFSLAARLEVFNILNRATPTYMMEYSLVPGLPWTYAEIWAPRRAQVGLKLRF